MAKRWHDLVRVLVCTSFLLMVMQTAADHASHRTLCCAYTVLGAVGGAFEVLPWLWSAAIWISIGCAAVIPFAAATYVLRFGLAKEEAVPWLTDCLYGAGAGVAVFFAWTAAMGHAEPNWAFGFGVSAIGVALTYSFVLLVTLRNLPLTQVRKTLWAVAALVAVVIPYLLIGSNPGADIDGTWYPEKHATSTRYLFATLALGLAWWVDTLLMATVPCKERTQAFIV